MSIRKINLLKCIVKLILERIKSQGIDCFFVGEMGDFP